MDAQFVADGARAAQSNLSALQSGAQAQDKLNHSLVVSLGRVFGSLGETVQRLPPLLLKALLPFEEPAARARDAVENLSRRLLFVKEPESQTAIANFVSIFLVHKTEKSRYERGKDSIYRIRNKSVRDVVRLLPN
jgi:hypothetical protein